MVTAKNIEHAEDLIMDWAKKNGYKEEVIRISEADTGEAIGTWVLDEVISKDELAAMKDDECGVVSASWNYA